MRDEARQFPELEQAIRAKLDVLHRMDAVIEDLITAVFGAMFPLAHSQGGAAVGAFASLPAGWTLTTLGEAFSIQMGSSPPSASYNEQGEGIPFYQGAKDFGRRFPTPRMYTMDPQHFAEAGDTLLSLRAPAGKLNVALERCCIGRGVAALRHQSGSSSYTYAVLKAMQPQLLAYAGRGTMYGSVGRRELERLVVAEPSAEAIRGFESKVEPLVRRLRVNWEQGQLMTKHFSN